MFDRFTDRAKRVMAYSRRAALEFNHEYIGPEHLLLAIVDEGTGVATSVLKIMGVDLASIRHDVEATLSLARPIVNLGQLPFTRAAKTVLENSMNQAVDLGHKHIGTEHLLLGLISEQKSAAAKVLVRLGADFERTLGELREFLGESADHSETHPQGFRTTSQRIWTHWYENGNKQSEGAYMNKMRQGEWRFWHEDGSIDAEHTGHYENNERAGD